MALAKRNLERTNLFMNHLPSGSTNIWALPYLPRGYTAAKKAQAPEKNASIQL
jgi:hypothetical protein